MKTKLHFLVTFIVLLGLLFCSPAKSVSAAAATANGTQPTFPQAIGPETLSNVIRGVGVIDQSIYPAALALNQFASSVRTGSKDVTGVFAYDVLAFPVVQQPSGALAFVSYQPDVVTQFSLAAQYGTIGILAHNFLAGNTFFNLSSGQDVYVVYGNGSTDHYVITQMKRFQALHPNSAFSNFIDLDSGAQYTSDEVFAEVYGDSGKLVLQTCINAEGIESWGIFFVIAEKVS